MKFQKKKGIANIKDLIGTNEKCHDKVFEIRKLEQIEVYSEIFLIDLWGVVTTA